MEHVPLVAQETVLNGMDGKHLLRYSAYFHFKGY
jgi:hypothetical protein